MNLPEAIIAPRRIETVGPPLTAQNRLIAGQRDRGDNHSAGIHIQNSISLTIPMLPRIIRA
jgi:hypothetical protein